MISAVPIVIRRGMRSAYNMTGMKRNAPPWPTSPDSAPRPNPNSTANVRLKHNCAEAISSAASRGPGNSINTAAAAAMSEKVNTIQAAGA